MSPAEQLAAHQAKKVAAVAKAEANLVRAKERLKDALAAYDIEIAIADVQGWFHSKYHTTRVEAVRASKWHQQKLSALVTARAERDAPTLPAETP